MRSAALALIGTTLLSAQVAFAQPAPNPDRPPENAEEKPAEEPMDTWGAGAPKAADKGPAAPPPTPPAPPRLPPIPPTPETKAHGQAALESDGAVRYVLEAIEVRGNRKTRARTVLRYVPFKSGDVIDVDDVRVELTRYRLLGTGFFRDVQLSLRKGAQRGHVVLVIEVIERNTIVLNDIWMGLSGNATTGGEAKPLSAYGGVSAAETNLAGTGITLGTAVAFGVPQDQFGIRVRFLDPASFLGRKWMTGGELLFNEARDFFGNDEVLFDPGDPSDIPDFAVVPYRRFGGNLGIGRDLSVTTQLWFNYRFESIDAKVKDAASHLRGLDREPIDFDILPNHSVLSTLKATLRHDKRDHPVLPTKGWFVTASGEVSLQPIGSDYQYTRVDVEVNKWWRLKRDHVIRLELFAGAIAGDPPFFEKYYVNDLSDFRPSRVLGLNFERRPSPNFLGTNIIEVRRGNFAGKIAAEYRIPLYRGTRSVFGIDFFTSFGIFGLADGRDINDPPTGYSGAARVPIDLTGNVGFRMDTSAGGFVFAFANALGFIPVNSSNRPEAGQ